MLILVPEDGVAQVVFTQRPINVVWKGCWLMHGRIEQMAIRQDDAIVVAQFADITAYDKRTPNVNNTSEIRYNA